MSSTDALSLLLVVKAPPPLPSAFFSIIAKEKKCRTKLAGPPIEATKSAVSGTVGSEIKLKTWTLGVLHSVIYSLHSVIYTSVPVAAPAPRRHMENRDEI